MTTSAGLAPQSQERKAAEPSPPLIATRLAVPAANRTAPVYKHDAPEGQCTPVAQSYTTVAEETGPHLPSELVSIATHQLSPAAMKRRPWHAMDALVSPPPALLRCCYKCYVQCTRFCHSPTIVASHTPAVEGIKENDCTTGCQLHPHWTVAPVQESLSGYEGPSALV